MKKITKNLLFLIFAVFPFSPVVAAEMSLQTISTEIPKSVNFQVNVILNTQGENINVVEGKVLMPESHFELQEIRVGKSFINFWVQKPQSKKVKINGEWMNEISFGGGSPGGFVGENGLVFSMIIQSHTPGVQSILFSDISALKNDGFGSESEISSNNLQMTIVEVQPDEVEALGGAFIADEAIDEYPPEPFTPEVTRYTDVFDNLWFVVFSTLDKGWGIDHYEILETRKFEIDQKTRTIRPLQGQEWVQAQSPYLLKDQTKKSYIFIKAVDVAGNEWISVVLPEKTDRSYENILFYGIIGLLFIIIVLRFVSIKKRKKEKSISPGDEIK